MKIDYKKEYEKAKRKKTLDKLDNSLIFLSFIVAAVVEIMVWLAAGGGILSFLAGIFTFFIMLIYFTLWATFRAVVELIK